MKWDKVTTNRFGDVLLWYKGKNVFSVYYYCFENHKEFGNIGWMRGFSVKDGLTKRSDFCG